MKLNNKGFTLLEVIISIAIMTSVIFIGYQVINKTDILRRDQILVSNMQNGTNNLKRYISKELSSSKEVVLKYEVNKGGDISHLEKRQEDYRYISNKINNISKNKEFAYEYIIHINDKDLIEYEIQVYKDKGKPLFSISRIDKNTKMNLVEGQPLSNDLIPMEINVKDRGMYDVELNYIKQKTKIYSFDVYDKLNNDSIDKSTSSDETEELVEYNYLYYCSQQINKEFIEAKNNLNTGFKKKLNEIILEKSNDLINLTKENPPNDTHKVKIILDKLILGVDDFKRYNSNQVTNIIDELNELEYYINASKITVYYLEQPKYQLNSQQKAIYIHNYTQSKIVPELQRARDYSYYFGLNNVYDTIHREFLASDILQIQNEINCGIVDNFNSEKDINSDSKKVASDINNLIDDIIDQQIIIKNTIRNRGSSNNYGNEALTYLDEAKSDLIKVKYMLDQTNYHQQ